MTKYPGWTLTMDVVFLWHMLPVHSIVYFSFDLGAMSIDSNQNFSFCHADILPYKDPVMVNVENVFSVQF